MTVFNFIGNGIVNAIEAVKKYLHEKNLQLKVEIEARSIDDVELILKTGSVDRIMLDNFSVSNLQQAVNLINRKFETEAPRATSRFWPRCPERAYS